MNGANGADGHGSLVSVSAEPAGSNCASGGQRIEVGVDDNDNGTLDAAEVDSTTYVCNGGSGSNGSTALVSVTDEPAGANCENGGKRIDTGVDDDHDGTLEGPEIDSTSYVCNGLGSLVAVTDEPAGSNCLVGGNRIDTGIDDDGDGTLDQNEIDQTAYVCDPTCLGTMTLSYTGTLQVAAIPSCAGTVTIEAWGAEGGGGLSNVVGGKGAYIAGSFTTIRNTSLTVLVGGKGIAGTNDQDQAGGTGGGGTFVVDAQNTPLVIAGGGGGGMGRYNILANGGPGQTTTSGQAGALNGGAGGTNGGGGATWPWSGWHSGTGGGGFNTNGSAASNGASTYGTINGPGIAFVNGGAGGTAGSLGRAGGFGGGGAAGFTGGGGGGYSGGGSGTHDAPQTYNGGGGGSFNAGTSPLAQSGVNTGNGRVVISWQ
jgi:hypothetical protein